MEVKELSEANADLLQIHYFQFPRETSEYKFYFVLTLQAFLKMFEIFRVFLNSRLKIIDPNWQASIAHLNPHLEELRKRYFSAIDRKGK